GPKSARLEDHEDSLGNANDHVVVEFVLDDDVEELRAGVPNQRPFQDPLQCRETRHLREDLIVSHRMSSSSKRPARQAPLDLLLQTSYERPCICDASGRKANDDLAESAARRDYLLRNYS